jgi:HD-GYP domain-containing protein (c-di-GMP phosphodiesterase class II)
VLTAPVVVGSLTGLTLTVAFENPPDRQTHEMLAAFHAQLQIAIEQSIGRGSLGALRWRAAAKLVEPDFLHYPELRNHCAEVTARAEDFARFLALTNAEVENVRLVATLHDVGMRLLEYERLYRKYDLSPEELGILREHPTVGAAIVEPVFGKEIARAVLSHHERMDGSGYPQQLHGDEIPLLSRIVQICDAYEAMVSTDSYQPPQSRDAALSTLALGGGTQFDRDLVQRFQERMRER